MSHNKLSFTCDNEPRFDICFFREMRPCQRRYDITVAIFGYLSVAPHICVCKAIFLIIHWNTGVGHNPLKDTFFEG